MPMLKRFKSLEPRNHLQFLQNLLALKSDFCWELLETFIARGTSKFETVRRRISLDNDHAYFVMVAGCAYARKFLFAMAAFVFRVVI
jgi:hypothetical protein